MSEKSKPKVSKSVVERLYSLMDLRWPGYLMTRDKKIIAWRGLSIFGRINYLVGAIYAHPKNLDQHATVIGDIAKMGRPDSA